MFWQPWGQSALDRARQEDKPILLSVGYAACHWCHVMAHESFENPDIAELMNALFVAIKVDREERPDVDAVYMQAVVAMTGQGGWPMTVFLTPDGSPFFGGTYFPPEARRGMPGLPTVLRAAHDAFRRSRADVERAGAEMRLSLAAPPLPDGDSPAAEQVQRAAARLVERSDPRHGGFGGAPKFPHTAATELLLRRGFLDGDPEAEAAARTTLDGMLRGGIRDQLGGGFHRYSVDDRWAVPHFEKMLYDNAQLAVVYLHAHQLTGDSGYRGAVEATLDYLGREMRLPGGGFASSQDADSEGAEGTYYIWTPVQIREALGDAADAEMACRVYGVAEAGNVEGGRSVLSLDSSLAVPHAPSGTVPPALVPSASLATPADDPDPDLRANPRATELGSGPDGLAERLERIRGRLLAARQRRVPPGRDAKVVTAWNGLALRAFAEAGAALDRQDYVETGRNCADFLLAELVVGGRLRRSWLEGASAVGGFLEDHACLGDGLLAVYEATGEPVYFERAIALAEEVVRRFRDRDGGYYDTAADAEPLLVRPRGVEDNPLPAGQSMAAQLFVRLAGLTGDEVWRDRAREIVRPLVPAITRVPLALGTLACVLDQLVAPSREVAVVGPPDEPATGLLLREVWRRHDPYRVLAWGPTDSVPLLAERPLVDGRPTAYVCEGFVCRAPTTDPAALASQLEAVVAPGR